MKRSKRKTRRERRVADSTPGVGLLDLIGETEGETTRVVVRDRRSGLVVFERRVPAMPPCELSSLLSVFRAAIECGGDPRNFARAQGNPV